jgi:hypothetical protein
MNCDNSGLESPTTVYVLVDDNELDFYKIEK